MNITLWAAGYSFIDLLKYTLFFFSVFNIPVCREKTTIPIWMVLSVTLSIGYYMLYGTGKLFYIIPNVCFFSLVALIKKGERLKGAFFIALTCIVMDSFSTFVRMAFFAVSGKEHYLLGASVGITLMDRVLVLAVPLLYHIVVSVVLRKKVDYSLYPLQWGAILVSFLGVTLIVLPLLKMIRKRSLDSQSYTVICMTLFVFLFLFIFVMIWQSHVMKRNSEMKQEEIKYQYMLKVQSEFFNGLKKNDDEIRIFKHDMRAHITALRRYITENDNERMLEYLDNMEEAIDIRSAKKYTNNVIVDAVINDQVKVMHEKEIDFEFDGLPQIRNTISDYDLCTVFYNVLKNAVEGCEKVESDHKRVGVNIENRGERLLIKICNDTVLKDMIIEDGLLTTKDDKENHGFGIKSVRAVVNRYDGVYQNEVRGGKYIVSIAI